MFFWLTIIAFMINLLECSDDPFQNVLDFMDEQYRKIIVGKNRLSNHTIDNMIDNYTEMKVCLLIRINTYNYTCKLYIEMDYTITNKNITIRKNSKIFIGFTK